MRRVLGGAIWRFSQQAMEEAGARHGPPFAVIGSNTTDLSIGRWARTGLGERRGRECGCSGQLEECKGLPQPAHMDGWLLGAAAGRWP